MRALTYIPRYTVKDYNQWEGDWELIDGLPYAMSPSPIGKHQFLVAELLYQLMNDFKKKTDSCGGCRVVSDLDWIVDDSTVLRPDIAVICKPTGDFITAPPVLIIEIISPSTALKDRQIKFEIYQEQGVSYYIIADPQIKTFQIFQLTEGKYKEQNTLKAFALHEKCTVSLDLKAALNAVQ